MRKMLPVIVIGVLGSSCLLSGRAHAENGVTATLADQETSYVFEDDPIAATGEVARGMRIRVRPGMVRTTLLRPRTHFVRELLKSAEDL